MAEPLGPGDTRRKVNWTRFRSSGSTLDSTYQNAAHEGPLTEAEQK